MTEEFEFAWYCSIGVFGLRLDSECEEVNDVVFVVEKREWASALAFVTSLVITMYARLKRDNQKILYGKLRRESM